MSMETITVFKESYEELQDREFKYMTENAKLKGTIDGLLSVLDLVDKDQIERCLKDILEETK